jgi:hypothetical protein
MNFFKRWPLGFAHWSARRVAVRQINRFLTHFRRIRAGIIIIHLRPAINAQWPSPNGILHNKLLILRNILVKIAFSAG